MEFIGPANVDNNVSGCIQCSIIEPNAQYCIQLVKSQLWQLQALWSS